MSFISSILVHTAHLPLLWFTMPRYPMVISRWNPTYNMPADEIGEGQKDSLAKTYHAVIGMFPISLGPWEMSF